MAVAVRADSELEFAAPVRLFSAQYDSGSFDVASDGRFLMTPVDTDTSGESASIVVVQNWTEELKRRVPVQ